MAERHPDVLDDVPMKAPDEQPGWADRPGFVKGLFWAIVILCVALLAIDPLFPKHEGYTYKNALFEIERWFGFYAIFSLICCVVLALIARALRWIVQRPEDYYDRQEGIDVDR